MPKELLDIIRALNTYKDSIDPNAMSFEEFIASITKAEEQPPAPTPAKHRKFIQQNRSYKVQHLDGTITVIDFDKVNFAHVNKDCIDLDFVDSHLRFTVSNDDSCYQVSQQMFKELSEFLVPSA